jgi:hypothetical protein
MTKDEIIEMAKQAGFFINDELTITSPFIEDICISPMLKEFAKLVAAKERDRYMQLFLDPENQPTQFGTATQEYRAQEIQEVQALLTELAHIVRTTHIYGPEMKKLLEQEEAIRARGES